MYRSETSPPDVAGGSSLTDTLPFPVNELGFREPYGHRLARP
jgi:hypothetical protein